MRNSVPPGGVLEGFRPLFRHFRPWTPPHVCARYGLVHCVALAAVALSPCPTVAADARPATKADWDFLGRAIQELEEPGSEPKTIKTVGVLESQTAPYTRPGEFGLDLRNATYSAFPVINPSGSNIVRAVSSATARPAAVSADAIGSATNISRDGLTIVGYLDNGAGTPYRAFRWTEATGLVSLGVLAPAEPLFSSAALDVSSDGSVVVGFSSTTGADHAFRWTQAGGMVDLGTAAGVGVDSFSSRGYGVSGDGSVVVGQSSYPPPDQFHLAPRRAFRWTQAGGFQDIAPSDGSFASVVTADGSVVVGYSQNRAFRWTQGGGLQDLGVLSGDSSSVATGVSDDGSIVVGISTTGFFDYNGVMGALRYGETGSRAFHWTAANGMQDLTQLLVAAGVDMTGKELVAAVGISPDGKWISAVTTRPDPEFPTLFVEKIPVLVSLTETLPPPSRLTNLSTRGQVQSGENVLIPGFVISGSANKRLLIRAVGPTLGGFGVSGTLADPVMTLKRTIGTVTTDIATNDNWGTNANAAAIASTTTTLGAFDLPAGSLDAALLVDLEPGQYSVVVQGVAGGTGVAIAEIYDGDAAPGGSRLANISTRGFVGTGESIMIPGYVVSADSSLRLLARAVGPTLGTFGVSGTLSDPQLTIRRDNGDGTTTMIASNDNWGSAATAPDIAAAATAAGAFELNNNSKDAAIVVQLLPGVYTVQASGVGGATGVALVEVYALE